MEPRPLPQTMGADGLQGGVNVGWVKTDICKKQSESVAFHSGKLTVYFGKEELAKTSQEETSLQI